MKKPSSKRVVPLQPLEVTKILENHPSAIFIDIRSSMEFLFVGHPLGALNVPWIEAPNWNINPDFTAQVRQVMLGGLSHESGTDSVPVVLICRSGRRSLEAGHKLLEEGFTSVNYVVGGFEGDLDNHKQRSRINGWRFQGLPWEQC